MKTRKNQILVCLHGPEEGAAIGPIDPPVQHEYRAILTRSRSEIEIQMMQLRHARLIAAEPVRVAVIAPEQHLADIEAGRVARGDRVNSVLDAKEPKLGIWRRFEFFVGRDFDRRRMIER